MSRSLALSLPGTRPSDRSCVRTLRSPQSPGTGRNCGIGTISRLDTYHINLDRRRQWRSPEATIPSPDSTPDLEATIAAQAAVIAELRVTIAEQARVIDTLTARVAVLERQLGRHSRNSSKPPSSDGLAKPPAAWRERRGGRRAGKRPTAPGTHLAQVHCPDEVVMHRPDRCRGCGRDLTLAVVAGVQARQVFDLPPVRLHS